MNDGPVRPFREWHARVPVPPDDIPPQFVTYSDCCMCTKSENPVGFEIAGFLLYVGDCLTPELAHQLTRLTVSHQSPEGFVFRGYDLTQVLDWEEGSYGCSPLTCNMLYREVPVNQYALLDTPQAVADLITHSASPKAPAEPPPYAVAAIWTP